MKEFLLERLREFIDNLTIYDKLTLGALALSFILFFILTIVLKNRFIKTFMLLLTVLVLIVGPFLVKFLLDTTIRKTEIQETDIKRLNFTNTLVISGVLKNSGKIEYAKCKINASVINKSLDNKYLDYLLLFFKPNYKIYEPIDLKGLPLKIGESMEFRVSIENFLPTENFKVDVRGVCY